MAMATGTVMAMEQTPTNSIELISSAVAKHVNTLVDPVASKRLEALKNIQSLIIPKRQCHLSKNSDARSEDTIEPRFLCDIVEQSVAKPMLKRIADSSEKCRCLSIKILSELLKLTPECMISLLPYIFPVISERFPLQIINPSPTNMNPQIEYKGTTVEPSEEVRLQLIQLVHQLLKQEKKLIAPFSSDVASILLSAANEKDPQVLVEVCSTLRFFAEMMGLSLKPVSKNLISAVLHALSHNRFRVRVAALQAIERLVLCGAHECIYDLTAYRDPNIIPIKDFYHPGIKVQYLALLSSDRSPIVREHLLKTVACWLLELPERVEHEFRLLPYVLNGFTDENKEIQDLAFESMESVGKLYEKENEDEVKDIKQYLPEVIDVIPSGIHMSAFKSRPCLGARIMVKRSFGILLHALSADLQAWQEEPKAHAAQLLFVLIMFVEENVTMHLQTLIQTLIKSCCNDVVEKKISDCARLLGYFVRPSAYLEILIPRINGECCVDTSVQDTGRALKVLSWIVQGSNCSLLTNHIPEICSLLTEQDLITSLQQEVHKSILSILEVMASSFNESCVDETIPFLWISLNAYAVGEIVKKPCHERIDCAIDQVSKSLGFTKRCDLIGAYLDDLVNLIAPPEQWSSRSMDAHICMKLTEETLPSKKNILEKLFQMLMEFSRCSNKDETCTSANDISKKVNKLQEKFIKTNL